MCNNTTDEYTNKSFPSAKKSFFIKRFSGVLQTCKISYPAVAERLSMGFPVRNA